MVYNDTLDHNIVKVCPRVSLERTFFQRQASCSSAERSGDALLSLVWPMNMEDGRWSPVPAPIGTKNWKACESEFWETEKTFAVKFINAIEYDNTLWQDFEFWTFTPSLSLCLNLTLSFWRHPQRTAKAPYIPELGIGAVQNSLDLSRSSKGSCTHSLKHTCT